MNGNENTFYVIGGTMPPGARSYVERRADHELYEGLRKGEFCYVLTSRQMGKSSLVVRTVSKLREQGVDVVTLDLTSLGQNVTPEQWYYGMILQMGSKLRQEDELEDFWWDNDQFGPCQRLFTALREVVLAAKPGPLVIFVDELDTVRSLPFATDEFFAAIRECYNRRADDAASHRLTFCLLGVATPTDLIKEVHSSPFNIGRRIELEDFSETEALPLALGFQNEPTPTPRPTTEARVLLKRILFWTHGHPYLTQRLCQAVAQAVACFESRSPGSGFGVAPSRSSPSPELETPHPEFPKTAVTPAVVDHLCEELFLTQRARESDDNLVFVRERILRSNADLVAMLEFYGQVLAGREVPDALGNSLLEVLRMSGIVKVAAGSLVVRNRIYARVFDFNWVLEKLEAQRATAGSEPVDHALAAVRDYRNAVDLARPTAQQKHVTVLCAEISGLNETPPSPGQSSGEPGDISRTILHRLASAIAACGGVISRQNHSSIRAFFGSKAARENEPEQAARAALAMLAEVRDFVEGSPPASGQLQLRIGLNTGPIIVKSSGAAETKVESGTTVQIAKRLSQAAPSNGILISHDACQHLREQFDVQPAMPLAFAGRSEPIPTYVLQRARPRGIHLVRHGLEGIATRMIGRDAELRRLQDLLATVQEDRELQIVTVVGEAGIGKSRLLYEFNRWLSHSDQGRFRLFHGRAREGTGGLPFSLLRDLFASSFEIQDSDRPAVARQKLEQALNVVMSTGRTLSIDETEEISRGAHFIGHLVGLDFSASPYLRAIQDDAKQIRDRALHYLTRFFQAASTSGPHAQTAAVLVLEDIHWADDASLELIDHLVGTCHATPLCILCLTRSSLFERRPVWGEGEETHTRITLQPLSRRDSRQLVEEMLQKASEIPPALRDLLIADGEGNPFYMEELVKMLIEVKVILPGPQHWQVDPSRLPAVRVPPTLAGVLQARLDSLAPAERGLLQRASVMGRVFWDSAVEQFISGAQPLRTRPVRGETLATLESLRSKEMVFRREASAFAGATEYVFRHALLRDVIYEGVLSQPRREFHGQAAAWLVEQSGERAAEFAGVIASHFEMAGELTKAADWYGTAGNQARVTPAPQTAIGYYEKALGYLTAAQAGGNPALQRKRLEWFQGLGESLGAQARYEEAIAAYESMRALAEQACDILAQAQAWNGLAFIQERRGANRVSVDCATRGAELAAQSGAGAAARAARVRALFLKGWAFYRLGDPSSVLAHGEQALALCKELEADFEKTNSLKLIAVGHLLLGRHHQAEEFFEQALMLARRFGDRRNVGAMLSNLGESARARGDYQSAVRYYQKAIGEAREIGNLDSEVLYLSNLGGALVGAGDENFPAAEAYLKQVLGHERQQIFLFSETYRFLAEALLGQGKVGEALDAARRALVLGEQTENQDHVGAAWRTLGAVTAHPDCQSALQKLPTAERVRFETPDACFGESLRVYRAMGAEAEQARTLRAWARHELQAEDQLHGKAMWQEAREIFTRLGMTLELERMATEESQFARKAT